MPPPVPSEGSPVSSSRRAYDAVEVRLHIFGMLEQSTLAVLMRVEKGVTASVASVLYREVSAGQARRMVRDTERQRILSDAVRTITLNPCRADPSLQRTPQRPPRKFKLSDLTAWQAKMPNIRKILADRSGQDGDHIFTVDIDGGKSRIELESHVLFDMYTLPDPFGEAPRLPPTPARKGVECHHTIWIKLEDSSRPRPWIWRRGEWEEALDRWRRWLYRRPLDPRVVAVDHSSTGMLYTVPDAVELIVQRSKAKDKAEPLRFVSFPAPSTFDHLGNELHGEAYASHCTSFMVKISYILSRALRVLHIDYHFVAAFSSVDAALTVLSFQYPNLQELVITGTFPDDYPFAGVLPLSGMPGLRHFTLRYDGDASAQGVIAPFICHLGGADCLYTLKGISGSNLSGKAFNAAVQNARLRPPPDLSPYAAQTAELAAAFERLDRDTDSWRSR